VSDFALTTKIVGFRETIESLQKKGQLLDTNIRAALNKIGFEVENGAKTKVPVDTGRLRSSIVPQVSKSGGTYRLLVGSNVKYAPYIEYGTKPHFVPTRAISTWLKRHGLQQKVLERTGLWVHKKGKKWFVPFSASPSLKAWAEARGAVERKAIHVSGKAHPFLNPAFENVKPKVVNYLMQAIGAALNDQAV